jgi:hypothetical protein
MEKSQERTGREFNPAFNLETTSPLYVHPNIGYEVSFFSTFYIILYHTQCLPCYKAHRRQLAKGGLPAFIFHYVILQHNLPNADEYHIPIMWLETSS